MLLDIGQNILLRFWFYFLFSYGIVVAIKSPYSTEHGLIGLKCIALSYAVWVFNYYLGESKEVA